MDIETYRDISYYDNLVLFKKYPPIDNYYYKIYIGKGDDKFLYKSDNMLISEFKDRLYKIGYNDTYMTIRGYDHRNPKMRHDFFVRLDLKHYNNLTLNQIGLISTNEYSISWTNMY